MMDGLKISIFIFIYSSLTFLYLLPNVNGNAVCLNCKALKDCKVPADFVAYAKGDEESKLVDKAADDPADVKMDVCLGPKKKISGTLTTYICSGGTDGYCHAIANPGSDKFTRQLYCAMCQRRCPCEGRRSKGTRARETAIFVPICLATFYILV
ncbi:uncharacterized protein LOC26528618 [Drosophila mojavensis]|uniref:Uncharacterized protein n=1 Tax=Drosophila mojavensis TaxID=7230 RepID=A0A0Q9XHH3_DROMO|nr:uncharacterized protein LOC26528618 [Drosophila mojavensis]KRG02947.1 uncharacterized protein Dmoj_GI26977 [Drosophila mojavensis]